MSSELIMAMVFWAGGLTRVPSALRSPDHRPLCGALLAFAVGLTVDIPAVYVRVDGWLGVPNVADLVEHVLGMVGVFGLLVTLSRVGEQPSAPVRRGWVRLAVLAAAIGASVGLFFSARLPTEAAHFTHQYGHLPIIAAYWSVTLAYFGVALIELAGMVATRSAHARRPALRVGLRVVGAGVIVGVVYSTVKIVELALDEDGQVGGVGRIADRLDPIVLVAGAIVVGTGLLLPAADTAWHHIGAVMRDRAALLRLRRLWRDLTTAMPEVVLGKRSSLWGDLFGRDASLRLHRRVVEIRDVALAARVGEAMPALAPDQVAALLAGLATTARPATETTGGLPADVFETDTANDADRDLRPVVALARAWQPGLGSGRM